MELKYRGQRQERKKEICACGRLQKKDLAMGQESLRRGEFSFEEVAIKQV